MELIIMKVEIRFQLNEKFEIKIKECFSENARDSEFKFLLYIEIQFLLFSYPL